MGSGRLLINLAAIAENYAQLCARVSPAECGAAVKANAYGLGLKEVGQTLYEAGCRTFFVAHLAEGAALRPLVGPDSRIFVLHGPPPGTASACLTHSLLPVLNSCNRCRNGRLLPARRAARWPQHCNLIAEWAASA
nr:alanine racemase [Acetobacter persici]